MAASQYAWPASHSLSSSLRLAATASAAQVQQHIPSMPNGCEDSCGAVAEGSTLRRDWLCNKTPEYGLVGESTKIKMLCVTCSVLLEMLRDSSWMRIKKVLEKEKQNTHCELMFSLYCLSSLCGSTNYIVFVFLNWEVCTNLLREMVRRQKEL